MDEETRYEIRVSRDDEGEDEEEVGDGGGGSGGGGGGGGGGGSNRNPHPRSSTPPHSLSSPSTWDGVERRKTVVPAVEPRFKLTLSSLAQIGVMLMTTGIGFAYLKADVEKLKTDQVTIQSFQNQNYQILLKVTELQTQVGSMRDEMVYYRQKLDQEIQRSRGAVDGQGLGQGRGR